MHRCQIRFDYSLHSSPRLTNDRFNESNHPETELAWKLTKENLLNSPYQRMF